MRECEVILRIELRVLRAELLALQQARLHKKNFESTKCEGRAVCKMVVPVLSSLIPGSTTPSQSASFVTANWNQLSKDDPACYKGLPRSTSRAPRYQSNDRSSLSISCLSQLFKIRYRETKYRIPEELSAVRSRSSACTDRDFAASTKSHASVTLRCYHRYIL